MTDDIRELLIFISNDARENDRLGIDFDLLGERLTQSLSVEPLAIGRDLLTGAWEIRLYFHPKTEADAREFLQREGVAFTLERE